MANMPTKRAYCMGKLLKLGARPGTALIPPTAFASRSLDPGAEKNPAHRCSGPPVRALLT